MIGNLKWLGSVCSGLEDSESTQPFKVDSTSFQCIIKPQILKKKNMIFYHFAMDYLVGITVVHENEVAGSNGSNEWPEKGV